MQQEAARTRYAVMGHEKGRLQISHKARLAEGFLEAMEKACYGVARIRDGSRCQQCPVRIGEPSNICSVEILTNESHRSIASLRHSRILAGPGSVK